MALHNPDDIVCYEIGSGVAASWEGTLCSLQNDMAALETHARRGLIRLGIDGGRVSIGGASRVGLVILPSGRRLVIRSKVSGLTILEWLAYLGEFRPLQRWLPERGIAAQDTDQNDWHRCIARLFLFAMEDVTRWHLRKDYAVMESDAPEIRGRIIATKLAQRMRRLPHIPQARRSRTFDVPFNAVLAKALDRVPFLLAGARAEDRQRMARLHEHWGSIRREVDDPIASVTCAQWASPPGYRAALQLARLILVGAVVDPQSRMGGHALTLSLASVWERALRRMCDELAEKGWRRVSDPQHTRRWDDPVGRDDPTRWLTADVILEKERVRWVLDAKYKREFGNEGRIDRFQMCAYAIGFDANRVSLVYPSAATDGDFHRNILTAKMGERVLRIDSIALPMSEGPQACLRRLASMMMSGCQRANTHRESGEV